MSQTIPRRWPVSVVIEPLAGRWRPSPEVVSRIEQQPGIELKSVVSRGSLTALFFWVRADDESSAHQVACSVVRSVLSEGQDGAQAQANDTTLATLPDVSGQWRWFVQVLPEGLQLES
jgi:hypothetical protein